MLYKRYTLTKVDINEKYLNSSEQSASDQVAGSESAGENYDPQDDECNGDEEKHSVSDE